MFLKGLFLSLEKSGCKEFHNLAWKMANLTLIYSYGFWKFPHPRGGNERLSKVVDKGEIKFIFKMSLLKKLNLLLIKKLNIKNL